MSSSNGTMESVPASAAIAPPSAVVNTLTSRAAWQAARDACARDPGAYHAEHARRDLHWFEPSVGPQGAWLSFDAAVGGWRGWDAKTGAPVAPTLPADHAPWRTALDASDAPFYRWFDGALTNACFNEIDRHVLAGHGAETAFFFEGDRWDQSLDGGRGGPVTSFGVTRRRLLLEVARCALALRRLGLATGDRVAINMPNIPEQLYWTEACKRLGLVYTPVFGGFSDKTLSDRIHNAGARVVITADGGYRNAQVVAFKEAYTDPALDGYVPAEVAVEAVAGALTTLGLAPAQAEAILAGARAATANEITLERSDVMRGVGRALEAQAGIGSAEASRIRTAIASALVDVPPRVDTVIVVRHAAQPGLLWRPERDRWGHELTAAATDEILAAARAAGFAVDSEDALLALPDASLVAALWAAVPPEPLDAEFPLFFIYTSGSTGKPKGVVLSHRNMVAGAKSVASYLGNHAGDTLLAALPLSFDAGFSQLTTAFHAGARVVLLNYLLPRDVLRALERERVTGLTAVPPLYIQLAALEWPSSIGAHLRYFANTGGRMPRETLQLLRQRVPAARPFLMYGLTEAFRSTYLPPEEVDRRPDSIGKAIPNAEILVLREDGTECAPDEPGELVHRGALVGMGYWNDPAKTAERYKALPAGVGGREAGLVLPEIAVYSGDTVRRDAEAFLYFIGRRDEMIKTSGYRVSPTEVEEVLYATQLVGECVAFGVDDDRLGQAIQVIATAPDGSDRIDLDALLAECRQRMPAYMVPAGIDARPGPLPRNPNGKLDRKALSTAWCEGAATVPAAVR